MTFRTLLIIKAVVCLVFGLFLLLAPGMLLNLLGTSLNDGGTFTAREYGAALIGTLLLAWFARDVKAADARGAILLDLLILLSSEFASSTGQTRFFSGSIVAPNGKSKWSLSLTGMVDRCHLSGAGDVLFQKRFAVRKQQLVPHRLDDHTQKGASRLRRDSFQRHNSSLSVHWFCWNGTRQTI